MKAFVFPALAAAVTLSAQGAFGTEMANLRRNLVDAGFSDVQVTLEPVPGDQRKMRVAISLKMAAGESTSSFDSLLGGRRPTVQARLVQAFDSPRRALRDVPALQTIEVTMAIDERRRVSLTYPARHIVRIARLGLRHEAFSDLVETCPVLDRAEILLNGEWKVVGGDE